MFAARTVFKQPCVKFMHKKCGVKSVVQKKLGTNSTAGELTTKHDETATQFSHMRIIILLKTILLIFIDSVHALSANKLGDFLTWPIY